MASVPTLSNIAGDVSGGNRIVRLGAAILARIAQIGHDGRDPCRASVLDRADEEQEPAQLVIGAHGWPAVQALDHVNVAAHDRVQRPRLVLAVLELALLVQRQELAERIRDGLAKLGRCLEGKELQAVARARVRRINGDWVYGLPLHVSPGWRTARHKFACLCGWPLTWSKARQPPVRLGEWPVEPCG
jgi:hypothetical protein